MSTATRIATSGVLAQQRSLDVIANNLANVSTPGFKRSRLELKDVFYQPEAGVESGQEGELVIYPEGVGVLENATQRMLAQGALEQTGNPLDLAFDGQGYFSVKLKDGTIAYTRDGHFGIDAQRRLVDGAGHPVEPAVTIPEGTTFEKVDASGVVWAKAADGSLTRAGQVMVSTFVNPGGLSAIGQNLFVATEASGTAATVPPGTLGRPEVRSGMIEQSNVDLADEMTRMIQAQRAYQLGLSALKVADQLETQAINVRR